MDRRLNILLELRCLYHLPTEVLCLITNYAKYRTVRGDCRKILSIGERYSRGPTSLAYSKDTTELLVLDGGRSEIQVYSPISMRLIRQWGTTGFNPGELQSPRGFCVDHRSGHVIVSDQHRIQEFTLDGRFIRRIGSKSDGVHSPWGVSIDSQSRMLYVAEFGSHRVSVFSLEDGRFVRCFGCRGNGDDQLFNPMGLHFDEERKLLLIVENGNHRVRVVNPQDGSLVRMIGYGAGEGNMNLLQPSEVTVDENGDVLITDTSNNRIQVFSLFTGQYVRNYTSTTIYHPTGICLDPNVDRLFVSEFGNHSISIFE